MVEPYHAADLVSLTFANIRPCLQAVLDDSAGQILINSQNVAVFFPAISQL